LSATLCCGINDDVVSCYFPLTWKAAAAAGPADVIVLRPGVADALNT